MHSSSVLIILLSSATVFGLGEFPCPPTVKCHNTELCASDDSGIHCVCPDNWAGAKCDRKVETCNDDHKCYHGGKCIQSLTFGSKKHFCDCHKASDEQGNLYVGKYCEHKLADATSSNTSGDEATSSVSRCQFSNDKVFFCVNGGECNMEYPSKHVKPCTCEDGYEGPHCEFIEGSVPTCNLTCENGGYCKLGIEHPSQAKSSGDPSDYMYCHCREGFSGESCEKTDNDTVENNENEESNTNNLSPSTNDDCLLKCTDNNATCAPGPANFSAHPLQEDGGVPLPFHNETSRDGYHCQCQEGWTGLECNHEVESCAGAHKCYHGGKCIKGLAFGIEQHFCDCHEAADEEGNYYVGKFCEHKLTTSSENDQDDHTSSVSRCQFSNDEVFFCVNNGECNMNYPTVHEPPCKCETGRYEGPHCEFIKGSVPTCNLKCENGGYCKLGIIHANQSRVDGDPSDFMYCHCQEGFSGENCEISDNDNTGEDIDSGDAYKSCDNDHKCYNGGSCVDGLLGVVGDEEHFCDCHSAVDGAGVHYVGKHCEHASIEFCNEKKDTFCVNGGVCNKDFPLRGPECICHENHEGRHCEFLIGSVPNCTLSCENKGHCELGISTPEQAGFVGGEDKTDYMRCECIDGFHGPTCSEYDETETELCTLGQIQVGQPRSFCINKGKCKNIILAGEDHPGCSCQDGWTGPHCEEATQRLQLDSTDNSSRRRSKFLGFGLALLIVVTVSVGWISLRKNQRRVRLTADSVEDNLSLSATDPSDWSSKPYSTNEAAITRTASFPTDVNLAPASRYCDEDPDDMPPIPNRSDPPGNRYSAGTTSMNEFVDEPILGPYRDNPKMYSVVDDGDDDNSYEEEEVDFGPQVEVDIGRQMDEDGNDLWDVEVL